MKIGIAQNKTWKKKNESFYLLCVYFQPTLYLMFLHFYETTGTV